MPLDFVAVELPEKQGLKLHIHDEVVLEIPVAVELPEKQGLKLNYILAYDGFFVSCSGTSRKTRIETINEVLAFSSLSMVAVELPEKQGLKHPRVIIITSKIKSCSGTSRKTRIETMLN